MTTNRTALSTVVATFAPRQKIVACAFASAMLMPFGALAMESVPEDTSRQAGYVLPLPAIRDLDSIRWMDWKPNVPQLKVDTLLLPDSTQPGVFRLPSDYEPDLPRLS